ncbi:hypothetical protein LINPERHAP2_LOCUS5503 [Linum perenne]
MRELMLSALRGGIWVLWHSSAISLQIVSSSSQFIHLRASFPLSSELFMTVVNGNPSAGIWSELWAGLRSVMPDSIKAWMVAGDFNALLASNGKWGSAPFSL